MIESLMLVAIGFLTATLFALLALQFVWRRAVTVTRQELTNGLDPEEAKASIEKVASQEIQLQDLRHEKSDLLAQYEEARAEADHHVQNIAALQERIAGLEAAHAQEASHRIAEAQQRIYVESELKNLGDRVNRFADELKTRIEQAVGTASAPEISAPAAAPEDEVANEEVAASIPEEAQSTETPIEEEAALETQGVEHAEVPEKKAEMSSAESEHLYAEELAAIKASLADTNERMEPRFTASRSSIIARKPSLDDDIDEATTEHILAERIRVLEAGVH